MALKVLLTLATTLACALVVGAAVPTIPYLGTMASFYVPQYLRVAVPVTLLLAAACLVLFLAHRTPWSGALLAMGMASAVLMGTIATQALGALAQAGATFSIPASYGRADTSDVTTTTSHYADGLDGPLDIAIHAVDDGRAGKPVILYVHGGGWVAGDETGRDFDTQAWAQRGYVVMSIAYDLSREARHTADVDEREVAQALAWTQQHAARFGGDGSRVSLVGDSAGGNLALEVALKRTTEFAQVDGVADAQGDTADTARYPLAPLASVSVSYPIVDLEGFASNDNPIGGGLSVLSARAYLGEAGMGDPARMASLSPLHNLGQADLSSLPPIQLILGDADAIVPPAATYRFADRLRAGGVTTKLVVVPRANHVYDQDPGSVFDQAFLSLVDTWAQQAV